MKIKILGSTKIGQVPNKDEILKLGGQAAGICYMKTNFETIINEDEQKTLKRIKNTLECGHHSVYGHFYLNIYFENIPKILAMILNNEKVFNTSEKSARYTKMDIGGKEKEVYEKWEKLIYNMIKFKYPYFEEIRAQKLAMENARYMISIFSPVTSMLYTVEYRQLNYIINWCDSFIEEQIDDDFNIEIKKVLKEFIGLFGNYTEKRLNTTNKLRKLSLFDFKNRKEEWGESYCTNYWASFSELAQLQRHRTIYYEMQFVNQSKYYIPKIIRNSCLEDGWLRDITKLYYPQGKLVMVNERGTYENFLAKCFERLCGEVQLETMEQTRKTLKKYIENAQKVNLNVYNALKKYDTDGPRCTFGFKCIKPCAFGKNAFKRNI